MSIEARSVLCAGAILVVCGIASLLIAPLAMSCVTSGDSSVCETAGTIVLNVVGIVQIAVGVALGGLGIRAGGCP